MTSAVEIREIRVPEDIAALNAHYRDCGLREPGRVRCRDNYFLAWQDELLAGSAMYWIYTQDDARGGYWEERHGITSRIELAELYVRPGHRSQGIGRMLIRTLAERAASDGIDYVWAEVASSGSAASFDRRLRFFINAGMQEITPYAEGHVEVLARPSAVLDNT